MDGFLWLLLQILPLLTLVAVLFFFLGRRSRRIGAVAPPQETQRGPAEDTLDTLLQEARNERDQALEKEARWRDKLTTAQIALDESTLRDAQLQKEILRLSDELRDLRQSAVNTVAEPSPPLTNASPPPADTLATSVPSAAPTPEARGGKSRKGGKKPRR